MKPKDFQQKTADRIVKLFTTENRDRVLLADEVGLGKTIVAKSVVEQLGKIHEAEHDKHFKVVYVCSNAAITSQNSAKLGIKEKFNVSESRLSLLHIVCCKNEKATDSMRSTLIPLTPATSFTMKNGAGIAGERALIYNICCGLDDRFKECTAAHDFFRYDVRIRQDTWKNIVEEQKKELAKWRNTTPTFAYEAEGGTYWNWLVMKLTKTSDGSRSRTLQLTDEIVNYCDCGIADRGRQRYLLNSLRKEFATISLDALDPDLIIMDEFQRFRDLICLNENSENEMQQLTKRFFGKKGVKILLLSATPYRAFTTREEFAMGEGDNHFGEFVQVMDFLFSEDKIKPEFKEVWHDYSVKLSQCASGDFAVLLASKKNAEDRLYSGICRTERIEDDGFIDVSGVKDVKVCKEDFLFFAELQRLMSHYKIGNLPVEYAKSCPYLLSFLKDYKLNGKITDELKANPEWLKKQKYSVLNYDDLISWKEIPYKGGKFSAVSQLLLGDGIKRKRGNPPGMLGFLWLPPSHPYYKTSGVYSKGEGASKVLLFSSWAMVPRMLATMLSYDAERLSGPHDLENSGVRSIKIEGEDLLLYPSEYLMQLYDPQSERFADKMDKQISDVLRAEIKDKIIEKGGHIGKVKRKSSKRYMAILNWLDGVSNFEGNISSDEIMLLARMAMAGPGVCLSRLFGKEYDKELGKAFISLFKKQENKNIVQLCARDENRRRIENPYYEAIIWYCCEGNLQSVLDEYAYMSGYGESTSEEVQQKMRDGIIDISNIPLQTQKDGEIVDLSIRTYFAMAYYNARSTDDAIQRTENIRAAFNSPFKPFLLATTSVGQEGLDFHYYCRKVVHWNLPSNPIDLEQREGRINRYQCLAIRQQIAKQFGDNVYGRNCWKEMFARAREAKADGECEMVPDWCRGKNAQPSEYKIERIIPFYPLSADHEKYNRLIKMITSYRLTLGQPRQEELAETLTDLTSEQRSQLGMNLAPYRHSENEE